MLAVSAETGAIVQETTVNPAGTLAFQFPVLPTGDYLFLAGTDFDGDGKVGESGDYSGAWPVGTDPQVVSVIQHGEVSNLDFTVLFTGSFPAAATSP